jgi:hypothetical protein
VLLNDGKGNFTLLPTAGLVLKGMIRDIQPVTIKNGQGFLFLQNDAVPVLFQLSAPKNKKTN